MAETTNSEKSSKILDHQVTPPVKGRLGKNVSMPKWLRAFFGYFGGAFGELKEVQWPNRRATWGLTLAVILFTAVMAGLILGLDYGFEQLFKRLILKG